MKGLPHDGLRYKKLDYESAEIEARYRELTKRKDRLEGEIAAEMAGLEAITDAVQFNSEAMRGSDNPTSNQMRRWLNG